MLIWEKIGKLIIPSGVGLSVSASPGEYVPGSTIPGKVFITGARRHRVVTRLFVHLLCYWHEESNVIRQQPQLPLDEVGRIFQVRAGLEISHSAKYEVRENSGSAVAASLVLARDVNVSPHEKLTLPFKFHIPPEIVKFHLAVSWELIVRGIIQGARDISAVRPISIYFPDGTV